MRLLILTNLDFSIFERSENSERNSLRAEMIRSAIIGRTNSLNNPSTNLNTVPTRENIDRLLEMGFTEENAKAALTRTRNDLSSAIELIMDDQLINPEARNDDFRMNANNSNILTNISNRNNQTGVLNLEINNLTNNTNNNIRLENNNDITNNNRINISRPVIPTISRATETNIRNNSNNIRRLNYYHDFDNDNSESMSILDFIEPFEIDLPFTSNMRENSILSFPNRSRHSSNITLENIQNRLNTIDRDVYRETIQFNMDINEQESLILSNTELNNNMNRTNIINRNSNNSISNSHNENFNNFRLNPLSQINYQNNNVVNTNINNQSNDLRSNMRGIRNNNPISNNFSNSINNNRNSFQFSNNSTGIIFKIFLKTICKFI